MTLYSNIQPDVAEKANRHRVTVEVLSSTPLDLKKMQVKVLDDLKKMDIFCKNVNVLYQDAQTIPQGFPVLSHEFVATGKYQYELAKKSFKNVSLHGKNNTRDWFMKEVFKSVHDDFG
ncbi:MAG: hypothetical protein HFP78_04035 [Methylococcales symbiont of Hymedesmia sp. n. MRB-2018]|nr:MAG: hypothetical protein HFP78_04035 [Methylococcales symbiont of Hymedesmia sp. n. MRB-2018]